MIRVVFVVVVCVVVSSLLARSLSLSTLYTRSNRQSFAIALLYNASDRERIQYRLINLAFVKKHFCWCLFSVHDVVFARGGMKRKKGLL
jgi:hypothetical protein